MRSKVPLRFACSSESQAATPHSVERCIRTSADFPGLTLLWRWVKRIQDSRVPPCHARGMKRTPSSLANLWFAIFPVTIRLIASIAVVLSVVLATAIGALGQAQAHSFGDQGVWQWAPSRT